MLRHALGRRAFLRLAAGAAALPALPPAAGAQAYPSRPLHIVVGLAAGGAADIVARLVGEWLSRRLGQPVVIENRLGGGGSVGAEFALRSPADGYTLFMAASAQVINAQNEKVNFVRDSAAVAMVGHEPIILSVNPSLPVRTLAEFIAYAKANPGKLSMASPGNGTIPHVAGEMFKLMAGLDMVHIPYRGRTGAHRFDGRAGPGCVHGTNGIDVFHQGADDSCARGDFRNARAGIAGYSRHR